MHRSLSKFVAPAISLAIAGGLSACMVGPDYRGPPTVAPVTLQTGRFYRVDAVPVSAEPPLAQWWLALNDAELTRLIDLAFADSPNLKSAAAKVRNARAMLREQSATLLPSGGASAAAVSIKPPSSIGSILGSGSSASAPSHFDLYSTALDASWELDFFGGVRRGVENAKASAEGRQASFEDAKVQLASEVARAYVSLRDAQHRAALSAKSADLENRELQLTLKRRAGGTASDADVERLRTQLSQTRADLLPLKTTVDRYLDQLSLLTGREPGALDSELAGSAPPPLPPSSVAIGDPAAMIRRRPDIRQAERQLAAENAAIGQNIASYFPTVTLLGTVGYAGTQTSGLFGSRNVNALGGPSLSWNVLNFPKVQAQVNEAKAQRDTALFNYEQTVLAALQDAEDSLSRFGHQRENVGQLTAAKDSAARAAELTRARYAGGTASLIDVLDTERLRLSTEQSLAQAQAMLTDDYVTLQKSLGLGWQDATSSTTRTG
ncbi:MAG TPA: efflux transporter outer membrane subunit [Caulobacteraceae bacterium]|nr:efflux transporter outer membrane subunit [Caulobacteraceae bacterium]